MAKRQHLSKDGEMRDCDAASDESCTAKGPDGKKSIHKNFSSEKVAADFAEKRQDEIFPKFIEIRNDRGVEGERFSRDSGLVDVDDIIFYPSDGLMPGTEVYYKKAFSEGFEEVDERTWRAFKYKK